MSGGLDLFGTDDVGSLADYSYGDKQVNELVQFFNALGRPKKFEAAVEAIYAAWEKCRTSSAILAAVVRDAQMKQIGADASDLMAKIQADQNAQSSATAPSAASSAVYKPTVDDGSEWTWTSYAKLGGALAAVGLVGYLALPLALPAIKAALSKAAARKVAAAAAGGSR